MKYETRMARYAEAIRLADEGSQIPHLREIVVLLREGLNMVEIAERLGLGSSTVGELLLDPTKSKTFARKHRRSCEECGAPINTASPGRGKPMRFCRKCAPLAYAFWTRETVIEAIKAYARRYGRAPGAMDWNLTMARNKAHPERLAEIEKRWDEGEWPTTGHVQFRFGSWSAGIRAAGLRSTPPGDRIDPERHRAHLRQFTDDEAVAAMQKAARGTGILAQRVYNERRNNGGPRADSIARRFGTWRAACEAAGLNCAR